MRQHFAHFENKKSSIKFEKKSKKRKDHNGGGEGSMSTTPSSRWPKDEIEALIKIRTSLDNKYQENGPKGPLWEEVSIEMNKLGYKRSSKRCKEKWENINKYFKKVKDNNKKKLKLTFCPLPSLMLCIKRKLKVVAIVILLLLILIIQVMKMQ
ncbi:hypothetical protein Leryth_022878 [Lithospermum erythrorhizon]|nr:hypothetical protein Leryth_022878 [Lithospermum erythrorhizon]